MLLLHNKNHHARYTPERALPFTHLPQIEEHFFPRIDGMHTYAHGMRAELHALKTFRPALTEPVLTEPVLTEPVLTEKSGQTNSKLLASVKHQLGRLKSAIYTIHL